MECRLDINITAHCRCQPGIMRSSVYMQLSIIKFSYWLLFWNRCSILIRLLISLRAAVITEWLVAVDVAECSIRAFFAGTTSSDSSLDVSITGRTILCGKLLADDVDGMALSTNESPAWLACFCTWSRILDSDLHQPRNVDSGTPMLRPTTAFGSPFLTLKIACNFSSGVIGLETRLSLFLFAGSEAWPIHLPFSAPLISNFSGAFNNFPLIFIRRSRGCGTNVSSECSVPATFSFLASTITLSCPEVRAKFSQLSIRKKWLSVHARGIFANSKEFHSVRSEELVLR